MHCPAKMDFFHVLAHCVIFICREGVRILKIGAHVVHKKFFGNFLGLIYIVNSEIFRAPGHPVRPI